MSNGQYSASNKQRKPEHTQVGIYLATGADLLTIRRCFIMIPAVTASRASIRQHRLRVEECLITNGAIAASSGPGNTGGHHDGVRGFSRHGPKLSIGATHSHRHTSRIGSDRSIG